MTSDREKSKTEIFLTDYFKTVSEGSAGWIFGGLVIGAGYGAYLGWTVLPPETVNLVQLLAAIVGLVIGAFVGAIAGFVGAHLFMLAIILAIIYGLSSWLFSS